MATKKHRRRKGAQPLVARVPRRQIAAPVAEPALSVVGIGASAGGLDAFTRLLRALPPNTGMAFVLVQHLAPARESALAEILARATTMPVTEAADRQTLEPNRVYVIPPDWNLEIAHGRLRLLQREPQGVQHPIDAFFRSLAANLHHRAIGVVLSGTATDGTIGLEEIKAEGGFTFAQDETAHHAGMPSSAIASGCVDLVLSPEAIAAEIARIATQPYVAAPPDGQSAPPAPLDATQAQSSLQAILQLLLGATGVDFTEYKASTLLRRITRRMVLRQSADLTDYARRLRKDAAELEALYKDILINVTRFFRDPEVFAALEQRILPGLFTHRSPGETIRVWVVACSTGEEAYSLAMVLSELRESLKSHVAVQIFATDISDTAIEHARAGIYSRERLQDLSSERAQRFFKEEEGSFRVTKQLRDMCRFSRHNVASDPPFSRMDLVSCRNLLIYVEPSLQHRILPILHYALKPAGLLVLGTSETVGQLGHLFGKEDAKRKIFRKKASAVRVPLLLGGRARTAASGAESKSKEPHPIAAAVGARASHRGTADAHVESDRLLASRAPPSVLVDGNLAILEFRGDTEPYLAPALGKASHDLLKMARSGLAIPLRALLHRAKKERAPVREDGLRFTAAAGQRRVDLEIVPVAGGPAEEKYFLVLFKDSGAAPPLRGRAPGRGRRTEPARKSRESAAAKIARLEHELASNRGYLQALAEQYEAANDALQASNEEAQSANEEFQSINEELETTKEEIQSSNEELTTINDELTNRNLELAQVGSDLTNLINSVQVAIVIVALDLRIRRFNSLAEQLFGIIPSDVGRQFSNIRMNLAHPELHALLSQVIGTSRAKEQELQTEDGRWYSLRIHPYLTGGTKIDGAVISLIDITAIRRTREYAESIVATVRDPLLVLDRDLRVRTASRSYYSFFGTTRNETEGRSLPELGGREWDIPELLRQLREVLPKESTVPDFELEREFKGIGRRILRVNARTLLDPVERQQSILFSIADVTLHRQQAEELIRRNAELAASDSAKNQFLAVLSHELRTPLTVIRLWSHILQRSETDEATRRKGLEILDRSSRAQARLVEDLLDVHRIASGKLRLDLAIVHLPELVRAVTDAIRPAAEEKGVRIDSELEASSATISGDPTRLQQVIGNVLENAIKFTPRGGTIRVALRQSGSRAELQVTDTGQGFPPAAAANIFKGFQPADPLISRSHGGLGLGLTIAKQLVDLHQGTISAASPGKDRGATITISLPLLAEKALALALPRAMKGAVPTPRRLKGLLVLVVDDDADAREALRWLLEKAGAKAIVVGSTDEALAAFKQQRPDVILSDIGMPERDGYDLVRTIRALPPAHGGRVPAIALTAYAAAEDRDLALSAGFQGHLAKPLDAEKIIAAIAALAVISAPRARGRKRQR